jgi:hypothetical protein
MCEIPILHFLKLLLVFLLVFVLVIHMKICSAKIGVQPKNLKILFHYITEKFFLLDKMFPDEVMLVNTPKLIVVAFRKNASMLFK